MGAGKRAVLIIISFFLILSTMLLIIGIFANSFLYPGIYAQSFEKSGLYRAIDENLENLPTGSFVIIPEGGSKVIIEEFLANILSYIRSDTDKLSLTLRIDQEELRNFFISEAEKIPVCRQNQDPFADKENPCRPVASTPEEFMNDYFEENSIETPDTDVADLTKVYGLEEGSEGRETLNKLRSAVQIYKKALYLLAGIIILGIILIFLLARSFKSLFRWVGSISLIAGAILMAGITFGENSAQNIQIAQDEITSNFVASVIPVVFTKIRVLVYITLVIGFCLVLLSFFFRKSKTKETRNKAPKVKRKAKKK